MTAQLRVNIDNKQPLLRKGVLFIVLSFSVYSSSANTPTQLIDKQITLYRAAYPEIEFKLLYEMADFDQLMPLTHSLGEDLSNVDYEHPGDLRITLVEAQEYRIAFQLANGNGTATLFKTPNARITNKPYSCLITLSIPLLDEAASAATQFMYDIGDDTFKSIPESYYIDNQDFLAYSIDHEVFHCIDAYVNGSLYPRTLDPLKACLDRTRAEQRTEIFAAMAHLSRQPNGKRFLKNLATARTVNLLSGDVEHYTSEVLYKLAASSELNIKGDIKALAEESMLYAENKAPSYKDHQEFLVALRTVLEGYSVDVDTIFSDYPDLSTETPSHEKVEILRNAINDALTAIHQN